MKNELQYFVAIFVKSEQNLPKEFIESLLKNYCLTELNFLLFHINCSTCGTTAAAY